MKLVGTDLGRVWLQVPQEEIRPLRGLSPLQTIPLLAERYAFRETPTNEEIFSSDPNRRRFEFRWGMLASAGIQIQKLNIYSDGFAVTCFVSEDADSVIADLMEFAKSALGFRDPQRPPRRLASSAVIVDFEVPLEHLIRPWFDLQRLLRKSVGVLAPDDAPMGMWTMEFQADPTVFKHADALARFKIERRVDQPYSANRYYSTAPLDTMAHVNLLTQIEEFAKRI